MMNFGLVYSIHKEKIIPTRWLSGRTLTSHAGDRNSIPGRERLKSLKKGSDSAIAKRSAAGVSVTGSWR